MKKIFNYIGLIATLASFIISPITTFAENHAVDSVELTQQKKEKIEEKESKIDKVSDQEIENTGSDKLLENNTSESNEKQSRAPSIAALRLPTDVSNLLQVDDVELQRYLNVTWGNDDDWVPIPEGDDKLTVGNAIRLIVKWHIDEAHQIIGGDTIDIDIPKLLRFEDTAKNTLSIEADDGNNYDVGTYQFILEGEQPKIRIYFDDTINRENIIKITSGYFKFKGSVVATTEEEEKHIVGGITLPSFIVGEKPNPSPPTAPGIPGKVTDFDKTGWLIEQHRQINWSIFINHDDIYRGFNKEQFEKNYTNAVLVDDLPKGLEITEIRAYLPIYYVNENNEVTVLQISSSDFKLNKIQSENDSTLDFIAINSAPAGSYIVSPNIDGSKKIMVKLGNLPADTAQKAEDSLKLSETKETIIEKINGWFDGQKLNPNILDFYESGRKPTIDAFEDLMDKTYNTGAAGVFFSLVTKVDDTYKNLDTITNEAYLTHDNITDKSDSHDVVFKTSEGGGSATIARGTVVISKLDSEGREPLKDAVFEVYKMPRTSDDKAIATLTTNDNGVAEATNLPVGSYILVEKTAPQGYSSTIIIPDNENSGISKDGEFEIKASDTQGFKFIILNKKLTTSTTLSAKKTLIGKNFSDLENQFSFELKDDQEKVIQTVKNDAQGEINFSAITYDKVGTYTYTISEVAASEIGMTYDDCVIKVTVEVTDDNGQLVAKATYNGATTFINKYKATTREAKVIKKTKPKVLPQTGEQNHQVISFAGLLLVIVLVVAFGFKRFTENKE